jgi:hypothetical protein
MREQHLVGPADQQPQPGTSAPHYGCPFGWSQLGETRDCAGRLVRPAARWVSGHDRERDVSRRHFVRSHDRVVTAKLEMSLGTKNCPSQYDSTRAHAGRRFGFRIALTTAAVTVGTFALALTAIPNSVH